MLRTSAPTAEARTTRERLRRNALVRHAPVTALLILIGVGVIGLGLIGEPLALLALVPLGLVIALYFNQVLAVGAGTLERGWGTSTTIKGPCIDHSSRIQSSSPRDC